jgi:hypothetical protein
LGGRNDHEEELIACVHRCELEVCCNDTYQANQTSCVSARLLHLHPSLQHASSTSTSALSQQTSSESRCMPCHAAERGSLTEARCILQLLMHTRRVARPPFLLVTSSHWSPRDRLTRSTQRYGYEYVQSCHGVTQQYPQASIAKQGSQQVAILSVAWLGFHEDGLMHAPADAGCRHQSCLDGSSSGGSISCATVASPWTEGCRCAITFVLSKPPCSAFALGGLSAASIQRDAVSDDLFPTKDARALCSDAAPQPKAKPHSIARGCNLHAAVCLDK